MGLADVGEEPRGDHGAQGRRDAENHLARRARGGAAHLILGPLQLTQDARSVLLQLLARIGEADAAALAHEKRDAEPLLEALHVPAQRRLRDVEMHRGARDAAELGDAHEVIKTPDVHGLPVMWKAICHPCQHGI